MLGQYTYMSIIKNKRSVQRLIDYLKNYKLTNTFKQKYIDRAVKIDTYLSLFFVLDSIIKLIVLSHYINEQ